MLPNISVLQRPPSQGTDLSLARPNPWVDVIGECWQWSGWLEANYPWAHWEAHARFGKDPKIVIILNRSAWIPRRHRSLSRNGSQRQMSSNSYSHWRAPQTSSSSIWGSCSRDRIRRISRKSMMTWSSYSSPCYASSIAKRSSQLSSH